MQVGMTRLQEILRFDPDIVNIRVAPCLLLLVYWPVRQRHYYAQYAQAPSVQGFFPPQSQELMSLGSFHTASSPCSDVPIQSVQTTNASHRPVTGQ